LTFPELFWRWVLTWALTFGLCLILRTANMHAKSLI
jgi:hypothetical protein